RRRRAESLPLLEAKFRQALETRFAPTRCEQLLALCRDRQGLEDMPVQDFVAAWTARKAEAGARAAGLCAEAYLRRRSTRISAGILAEISSTEKCVVLRKGMFSRWNSFSTSRSSNSHWAKLA